MKRRLLFAANWKMHLGPVEARVYAARFRERFTPRDDRETWFFPPAVSLEAAAEAFRDLPGTLVGAQDIHWEPKGAFTGAISGPLARAAGAAAALIGHSERRHVFGETEPDTARKLRAALRSDLIPVLCVGEQLEQRERGETEAVVRRQLMAAIEGLGAGGQELGRLVVA
ncbi:MAG TPA: triose-phosphate isomerase, partial [Gemmatimonadales bacterium]|nr:triose-phosphate isomerase [Gemmatimonadales bacterium]